ncbi:MAG TPA: acyl-CoA dehydrogenase family protein [Acidimicrobiales bacterium]|nr:acyl-CoA dehydrogenase family protein [Acidimicrobiales bacterium]
MDLALPGDDHPARAGFRAWLDANPDPSPRQLAAAGYVAPHWPRPWGLEADPIAQLVIDDEMRRAGVRRPFNQIGIGWAGPTLVHAGTEAQKERYLLPLLAGEEIWCQLFSEPGAGSDLAGLSTRALRDGDEWVVSGQKVWTSFAHIAALGILLARTEPDVPKHRGVSYFICPMDAPGVTIRPIVDMTGDHAFNEVFLDEVRLPAENLVGEVNGGWGLAKVTLGNERVSLSGEGALWGQGPTVGDLLDIVRRGGPVRDAGLRQRLARVFIEGEVLRLIRLRTVSAAVAGRTPGPEASVRKALADDHGQRIMELAQAMAGTFGMLADAGPAQSATSNPNARAEASGAASNGAGVSWPSPVWAKGYLFSRALTIGGGTAEVQRNIIAERVLGLPHDVDVEASRSWAETHRAVQA